MSERKALGFFCFVSTLNVQLACIALSQYSLPTEYDLSIWLTILLSFHCSRWACTSNTVLEDKHAYFAYDHPTDFIFSQIFPHA